MHENRSPPVPKCRRSLRPEKSEESCYLNNNFQSFKMAGRIPRQRNTSNVSEAEKELSRSRSYNMESSESSEEDEEAHSSYRSQNRSQNLSQNRSQNHSYSQNERSRTTSPGRSRSRTVSPEKPKPEKNTDSSNTSSCSYVIFFVLVIATGYLMLSLSENKVQTQSVSDPTILLSDSIKNIKATFHNQESDIWNDISSAINEVISSTPKIPSIILLFAKETTTMDCLANQLAHMSSNILHADSHLVFNPQDFGTDAGEIITILNEHSPEKKKVVIIRDILNIDAEAIKALHNLCDRINPLVAEAVYILTMQTNSSQSRQKKLHFVENQIYNKLSKSIDHDILMALVTRITDGAIISVQPEPQVRYC